MSKENVYLLILTTLLCGLNLLFGPLAAGIARLFGRSPRDFRRMEKDGAGGQPPSGPGSSPPAIGDAQISKYR
jgi:hypothetical protein